jgi:hypothetical protein
MIRSPKNFAASAVTGLFLLLSMMASPFASQELQYKEL